MRSILRVRKVCWSPWYVALFSFLFGGSLAAGAATKGLLPQKPSAIAKPRVIILSDFPPLDVIPGGAGHGPAENRSDPDDVQSMVRFLVYANEFDAEGLVASAGTFANIARKQNILDILNLYDQVDENLRKHDSWYPTADQLRAVTWATAPGASPSTKSSARAGTARHRKPSSGSWTVPISGRYGCASGEVRAMWCRQSGECRRHAALPSWSDSLASCVSS